MVACLNDIAVSGWLAVVPYPYAPADFHQFQTEYAAPGRDLCRSTMPQGFAGIVGVEDRTLGYWFAPRCHGRAMRPRRHGRLWPNISPMTPADIASGYYEGNARSANVLAKLGFVETGRD